MLKLVTTESFDTMLQNLGSMISVVETNAMHKSAASNAMSREMLLANKPDKDHFLLHIIALGDHERYGQNRNQDAFPKAANQRYHSTFTKHAHFFREHKNQDPKFKIGDVKASIYNEEMGRVELAVWGHKKLASDVHDKLKSGKVVSGSMACFPAGTKVNTPNGFVNIENLNKGDIVFTHTGKQKPITKTMQRTTDSLHRIATGMLGKTIIEATKEHPFYATHLTQAQRLSLRQKHRQNKLSSFLENKLEWVEAADLTTNHYLAIPKNLHYTHSTSNFAFGSNKAFSKLLGYVLGDGSIHFCKGNPNTIAFTCGHDDVLLEELPILLSQIDVLAESKIQPHRLTNKAVAVRVHSAELARLILHELHGYAENKQVPKSLFSAPAEDVFEFFSGWINSDGFQTEYGISISTACFTRATDAQRLLFKNGVASTINKIVHKATTTYKQGSVEYVLNIPSRFIDLFSKSSTKLKKPQEKLEQWFIFDSDNYFYVPIRSIEVLEKNTNVYNLSVKDDESYLVSGIAVHNCTVPYDRDNCTGKLARSPAEYEPHMKTRPGQWIEEFQKFAFVHNDHPRFFDYSYVSRPADRIAHYLDYILNTEENESFAKAASSNVVPGALLAKAAGIQSPLTSEIYDLDKRAILIKLAEAEGDYAISKGKPRPESDLDHFVKIASFTFNPNDTITDTEISAMRRLQPGTLFAELGKRAVTLPFPAFVAYATGRTMADVEKDNIVKAASLQLPKIFRKMLSGILPFAEGEEDMFDGHRMTFMSSLDPECDSEIDKLFKSLEARYSVEPTIAGHRTMSVSVLFDDKDTAADPETEESDKEDTKKKDTEKAAAERLAGLYGLYKLSALKEMQKNAKLKLDNSLLFRVVSQNQ